MTEFRGRFLAAGFDAPKRKHVAESPPMIIETSLMPAGKPFLVMR